MQIMLVMCILSQEIHDLLNSLWFIWLQAITSSKSGPTESLRHPISSIYYLKHKNTRWYNNDISIAIHAPHFPTKQD